MTFDNILRNLKGRSNIRVQLLAIGFKVLNYCLFHSERPCEVVVSMTCESDLSRHFQRVQQNESGGIGTPETSRSCPLEMSRPGQIAWISTDVRSGIAQGLEQVTSQRARPPFD